ncbi:MAG: hypothetical protein AVO34_08660 [Firmicutes bacterium ML8_F2]|nr:MAG: hypothetical protein AVO34_08660 [Firmicutes bacterium ML8_F2]
MHVKQLDMQQYFGKRPMTGNTLNMGLKTLAHLFRHSVENLPSFQYVKNITGTKIWIIAYLARNNDKVEEIIRIQLIS